MDQTGSVARAVAVIPARYASTRFPAKPLALIGGHPMIEWVWRRARAATQVSEVLVATDDERIARVVTAFGGHVVMTDPALPSGTDRVAAALCGVAADIVVNIQGDEPLLPPRVVDSLVNAMRESRVEMGTVAVPLGLNTPEYGNPNIVKVVVNTDGCALYFSRAPIPYARDGRSAVEALWHWGLYAYRRDFLEQFVSWPPSPLEQCEKLEQLRALEHGARIKVIIERQAQSAGVDVPDDVAKVESLLRARGEI